MAGGPPGPFLKETDVERAAADAGTLGLGSGLPVGTAWARERASAEVQWLQLTFDLRCPAVHDRGPRAGFGPEAEGEGFEPSRDREGP